MKRDRKSRPRPRPDEARRRVPELAAGLLALLQLHAVVVQRHFGRVSG